MMVISHPIMVDHLSNFMMLLLVFFSLRLMEPQYASSGVLCNASDASFMAYPLSKCGYPYVSHIPPSNNVELQVCPMDKRN